MIMTREIDEHMAIVGVVGRRVVHIVVVDRMGMEEVGHMMLAVVGHIGLVAAVAVHRTAESEAGHIEVVAVLGRAPGDTAKTSGPVVEVEEVCCILFALEDMVKMANMVVGCQAEDKVTVVVLENRDEVALAVRVVGQDMDW
jgi:hypothetical protein